VKTSRYTRLQTSTPRHTGMAREWNIASSHNVYSSTISHHTQTSDSRSRSSRHTQTSRSRSSHHTDISPSFLSSHTQTSRSRSSRHTHRRLALVPLVTHRDVSPSFLSSHTQTSRSHHTQTFRSRHTHRRLTLVPLVTQTSRSRFSRHTQTSRSRSSHHTHRHLALVHINNYTHQMCRDSSCMHLDVHRHFPWVYFLARLVVMSH